MEKTTAELIQVLKGNHNFPTQDKTYYDVAERYCKFRFGSTRGVNSFIKNAVLDFIKTCDKKVCFLVDYFDGRGNEWDNWCRALALVQVKELDEDGEYHFINGFNEELVKPFRKEDYK